MTNPFRENVIWITGASSGIGEQLAFAFVGGKEAMLLPFRRCFPRTFYRFLGSHPTKRLRRLRSFLGG